MLRLQTMVWPGGLLWVLNSYFMNSENSSSKLAVIFGGEEIQAALLDGSTLLVRVRAMPVRQLSRVLELCASESELLEFV